MKVIEQTISPKGVKTEIISVKKKKYKRISWKAIHQLIGDVERIEWRRFKTNHLTKKEEQDKLEDVYKNNFPTRTSPDHHFGKYNLCGSGSAIEHRFVSVPFIIEDDKERRRIERGLVKVLKNGNFKLAGVKYIKEQVGCGIKEAKEFVEAFLERRNKNLMS